MKIHFPAPFQPDNPRLYVPYEIALNLAPNPEKHLWLESADVDYYLIDSQFNTLKSDPHWDTLVCRFGSYVDNAEMTPINNAKLGQLINKGNVVLVAVNQTNLAVWTNTGKFTLGIDPSAHIYSDREHLAEVVNPAARRFDEIETGDWFKLQSELLVKTGSDSCANGGASEQYQRFWLPAATLVMPQDAYNFALVPGSSALFEDLKIGERFLFGERPFVKVHFHAGQPGRERIPSIQGTPFAGPELVTRAELPSGASAFLFAEELPAPPDEIVIDMASLPAPNAALTPDMIAAQAERGEQLSIQMDTVVERGLKNENEIPEFGVPLSGVYYIRLTEQEKSSIPNPELTHYLYCYDGVPLCVYRLVPGEPVQEVLMDDSELHEIVASRKNQVEMDADHKAILTEIKETVFAIKTEAGLVLPRILRYPVVLDPANLDTWPDKGWHYLRIEKKSTTDVHLELYAVPAGDTADMVTPPQGSKLLENLYAGLLRAVTDSETRDKIVAASERIGRMIDTGARDIVTFETLKIGDVFRPLYTNNGPMTKHDAEHAIWPSNFNSMWRMEPNTIVVVEQNGLDQVVDSGQNGQDHSPTPLLDAIVEEFDSLKNENGNEVEPEHYVMLIEHGGTHQKMRIVGTRRTDQRLHFLVQRMFDQNWFLIKYSEIEESALDIFREVGEEIYELGKDYK